MTTGCPVILLGTQRRTSPSWMLAMGRKKPRKRASCSAESASNQKVRDLPFRRDGLEWKRFSGLTLWAEWHDICAKSAAFSRSSCWWWVAGAKC